MKKSFCGQVEDLVMPLQFSWSEQCGLFVLSILAYETFWPMKHFGLCQEHSTMRVKDFIFKEDENGCEYVEFIEDPKKN